MKRQLSSKKFLLSCIIFIGLNSLASAQTTNILSGEYFNVSAVSGQLTISSNIAGWNYPQAGIKVINPGYALSGVGSECTMATNGYCLFAIRDTQPVNLSFTGPAPGNIEVSLCLNGSNANSCQNYAAAFPKINYAYVSNLNAQTPAESIVRCEISDVGGSLSACSSIGFSTLDTVFFLAMSSSGKFLYTNTAGVSSPFYPVQQCELNLTGIVSCSVAMQTLYYIGGTAINPAGNKYYYTDNNELTVNSCDIENSGSLVNCGRLAADFSAFSTDLRNIRFNSDGSLAYVAYAHLYNGMFNIKVCRVNADGTFDTNSCVNAASTSFSNALYSLAIDPSNQYAYVTDGHKLQTCTINSADGTFSACTANSQSFGSFTDVTLNPAGTLAYIPEGGFPGQVSVCKINSLTGLLDTCQASGSGFDNPFSLVLSP